MEEQLVTLTNIEDKTKVEEDALLNNNNKSAFVGDNQDKLKDEKTDVELKKVEVKKEAEPLVADADAVQPDADAVQPDADAVDKIAAFAAAPEEQFFEGEDKLEAVDSKIGSSGTQGNKVEVVARNATLLANHASPLFSRSSFLLLPLLLLLLQSLPCPVRIAGI